MLDALSEKAKEERNLKQLKDKLEALQKQREGIENEIQKLDRELDQSTTTYLSTLSLMEETKSDKLMVKGITGASQPLASSVQSASPLLPLRQGKRGRPKLATHEEIMLYLKPILLGDKWWTLEEIRKMVADRFSMSEATAERKLPGVMRTQSGTKRHWQVAVANTKNQSRSTNAGGTGRIRQDPAKREGSVLRFKEIEVIKNDQ